MERILEVTHTPRQYWVSFATIQLNRVASLWWLDLGADSRTTSWSSFTEALQDEFGVSPAPLIPVMHLVVDPEEDPEEEEEDLSKDPIDDDDHVEAEGERVAVPKLESLIPRGARPIVISTQPQIIRTAVVARGRPRGDGASMSQALPLTLDDRAAIME